MIQVYATIPDDIINREATKEAGSRFDKWPA